MSPPPEGYISLLEEVREVRKEYASDWKFIKQACSILSEAICVTTLIVIMLTIHCSMIVVGVLNLNSCPVEQMIPIWLIGGGSIGTLIDVKWSISRITDYRCTYIRDEDDNYCPSFKSFLCCTALIITAFAWFIAGNVWVYRSYIPNTDLPGIISYCNPTSYFLAFWIIAAFYICLALATFYFVVNCVCMQYCSR